MIKVQLKRLENDWVEIRSGKSILKIVGMEAKEFPQFPKFDSKSLSTTPAGKNWHRVASFHNALRPIKRCEKIPPWL